MSKEQLWCCKFGRLRVVARALSELQFSILQEGHQGNKGHSALQLLHRNHENGARHCPLIAIDDHSCDGDVDHGEIAVDCFFETGGDSAVLFEPSDESFDDISLAVE